LKNLEKSLKNLEESLKNLEESLKKKDCYKIQKYYNKKRFKEESI
jgi:hypothetical protein